MKRWLTRILVFMLLGAIVNVAVAWGFVWWAPINQEPNGSLSDGGKLWWDKNAPPTFARPLANYLKYDVAGRVTWVGYAWHTAAERNEEQASYDLGGVDLAGWPLFALSSNWWAEDYERAVANGRDPRLMQHQWRFGATDFPVLPIWPGFAINTVFYAGILWGLFAAPIALRRRRRMRRGLCPACAYDLRGAVGRSQTCPECGQKLPMRKD